MQPVITNPYLLIALPLLAFAGLGLCAYFIERKSPAQRGATHGLSKWEREQRQRNLVAMEKREDSIKRLGDSWVLRPDRCELTAGPDAGVVKFAKSRKAEWAGRVE